MNRVKFNNSKTHAVASTRFGVVIYSVCPKDALNGKAYDINSRLKLNVGSVSLAHIFAQTNILCFVKEEDPNVLVIWDAKEERMDENNNNNIKKKKDVTGKLVGKINLSSHILNVFLLRTRIIIVFEKEIIILPHEGSTISTQRPTFYNPSGLCSVVHTIGGNIEKQVTIATLGVKKGEIAIWTLLSKTKNESNCVLIEAHENDIAALKLSHDGSIVATASTAGTIIKVFNTKTTENLYNVRRGTNIYNSVSIHDLCISPNNKELACYSSNGTIHIFDLEQDEEKNENTKSYVNEFAKFIPLPQIFSDDWSKIAHRGLSKEKSFMEYDPLGKINIFNANNYYYNVNPYNKKKTPEPIKLNFGSK